MRLKLKNPMQWLPPCPYQAIATAYTQRLFKYRNLERGMIQPPMTAYHASNDGDYYYDDPFSASCAPVRESNPPPP